MLREDVPGLAVRGYVFDVNLRIRFEVGPKPRADWTVRRRCDGLAGVGAHGRPFNGNRKPARIHSMTVYFGLGSFGIGGAGLDGTSDFDRLQGACMAGYLRFVG
jgi:hypothetical protein